jgi:hypothetical protein
MNEVAHALATELIRSLEGLKGPERHARFRESALLAVRQCLVDLEGTSAKDALFIELTELVAYLRREGLHEAARSLAEMLLSMSGPENPSRSTEPAASYQRRCRLMIGS